MVSLAHGAQTITINEGTTEFGPITVATAQRYAAFSIDRWTNPAIILSGVIQCSTDGGNNYFDLVRFTAKGGTGTPTVDVARNCPEGSTHIKGSVTVTGGNITISRQPDFRSQ